MTSQLPPLAEQRAALNAAWLQMERAEAERELLLELLRDVHLAWHADHDDHGWHNVNDGSIKLSHLDAKIVRILRGTPVAEVLRPDEDPDMEDVPF